MFETFSFLPPLSDREIANQVDYIIANGWTPCLEFADSDCAYVQDKSQARFGNSASAVRVSPCFGAVPGGGRVRPLGGGHAESGVLSRGGISSGINRRREDPCGRTLVPERAYCVRLSAPCAALVPFSTYL